MANCKRAAIRVLAFVLAVLLVPALSLVQVLARDNENMGSLGFCAASFGEGENSTLGTCLTGIMNTGFNLSGDRLNMAPTMDILYMEELNDGVVFYVAGGNPIIEFALEGGAYTIRLAEFPDGEELGDYLIGTGGTILTAGDSATVVFPRKQIDTGSFLGASAGCQWEWKLYLV